MTPDDKKFVADIVASGLIKGPVLELGGGLGDTCRDVIIAAGLDYLSTDMEAPDVHVDYIANFESGEGLEAIRSQDISCVLVLNVLEHTFEPIKVLDNALSLLKEGGTLVVVTPCVWPIHNYPIDCCRLLPDWYRAWAKRSGAKLDENYFQYLSYGTVNSFKVGSLDRIPPPAQAGLRSRIIHRLFNTSGRGTFFNSHIAIGVMFSR